MMKSTNMSKIVPLAIVLILVVSIGALAFTGRIPTGKGAEAYVPGEAGGKAEWVVTTYYADGEVTQKRYGEFDLAQAAVFSPEGEEIVQYDFGMSFDLNDGLWASSVAISDAKLDFVVDEKASNLGQYSAFQIETIILKGDALQFDSIEEPKISISAFEDLEKPLVEKFCVGLAENECFITGIASITGKLEIMAMDADGGVLVMEGTFPPVSVALGVVNGDIWNYQKPSWKSVCDSEGSYAGWISMGPWDNLIKYDENNPTTWEMEEANSEGWYKGDLECDIEKNLVFNKNEYTCTPVICTENGQIAVNGKCQDIDCSVWDTDTVEYVLDRNFIRSDGGFGICLPVGIALDPSEITCGENEDKVAFNQVVEQDGEEIPVYKCVPVHSCDDGQVPIYNEDDFQQQCIVIDCPAQGQWTDKEDATKCIDIPDCASGSWRLSNEEHAECAGGANHCLDINKVINGDGTGCKDLMSCDANAGWMLSNPTDTTCTRTDVWKKQQCLTQANSEWQPNSSPQCVIVNISLGEQTKCLARNPTYAAPIWKFEGGQCLKINGGGTVTIPNPGNIVVTQPGCGYLNMGNCGTNTWTPPESEVKSGGSTTTLPCGYICTQNGAAAGSGNVGTSVVVTCSNYWGGCDDATEKTATVVNTQNAQDSCKKVWSGYPENKYVCQMVMSNTANDDTANSPNTIVNVAGNAGGNSQTSGHVSFGGYPF